MKYFLITICILAVICVLDNVASRIYCLHSKKKSVVATPVGFQYRGKINPLVQVAKSLFSVYRGWIRFKLIRLGRIPCHWIRNFILRNVYLMKIAPTAVIYGGFEIRAPWNIEIGEGSIIGDESKLDGRNGICIGRNVNFSTGVWIWTEQHDLNDKKFSSNNKGGKVTIGDRAWVSSRTVVLPKVTIGEGAVIAAGAVITKDCEPFGIYGGIPGKKIGERSHDLDYIFSGWHEAFW